MSPAPEWLEIRYVITPASGAAAELTLRLDPRTLQLQRPPPVAPAAWTRLDVHQCPTCPLQVRTSPWCPAALSLEEVVARFGAATSHHEVLVRVETPGRTFEKRLSTQQAMSSLIGLLLATSGCPVLAQFRPLAQHHLPFATVDETKFRVLGMYLLAQYVRALKGQAPDWALRGLHRLYTEVQEVNAHLAKRLREVMSGDAPMNAIVILDTIAQTVPFTLDQQMHQELEQLFAPFLSNDASKG